MRDRDYIDYLQDILDSIEKIEKFVQGMTYYEFEQDDKTLYAVIHAIGILGEASKKIPKEIRDNYKNFPWREIAGMKDKLIHDYFGVNIEVVWKTATIDVPKLKSPIKQIITELQSL